MFPPKVLLHPTFHISQLTYFHVVPFKIIHPPVINLASPLCPTPEVVLDKRMIKRGNKAIVQWLIKWTDMDPSYATWELVSILKTRFPSFTLEDKGVAPQGSIDTTITD